MINIVKISRKAEKDLKKVPVFIKGKLLTWVEYVESFSLEQAQKIPGFHDEPLKGKRKGQRSIRLNRAYRCIYEINSDQTIEFVSIEEVNKHEY